MNSKFSTASHSDASISLVSWENSYCVQKINYNYNSRFIESIKKQREFPSISLSGLQISAAPIIHTKIDGDNPYMIMQYVKGISGEDFAIESSVEIANEISRGLSAVLMNAMVNASTVEIPVNVYLDKFDQVAASSMFFNGISNVLNYARKSIINCIDSNYTLSTPVGSCHGDLTLSNIIYSQSQGIILIDFLTTFLDSPLQDVAKILQDFDHGWSFRKMDENLQIKAAIFTNKARPKNIEYICNSFPKASFIMKILCLARIAPYIKDSLTANWLENAILKTINSNSTS